MSGPLRWASGKIAPLGCLYLLVLGLLLTACASQSSTGTAPPTKSIFDETDRAASSLLDAQANWHHPPQLTVDTSSIIELSLGDSPELQAAIRNNLPNGVTTPAGEFGVGPDVQAQLYVSSADADVKPDSVQDASTTDRIALSFLWTVRPLRPTSALSLTAHVMVPLQGTPHVVTHDVVLTVPVKGTSSYWFRSVMTNWGTLSAMFTAVIGTPLLWLWRRKRTEKGTPSATTPESTTRNRATRLKNSPRLSIRRATRRNTKSAK